MEDVLVAAIEFCNELAILLREVFEANGALRDTLVTSSIVGSSLLLDEVVDDGQSSQ